MLEGILATEEEHADDLRTLIEALGREEHGSEREGDRPKRS
jgi:bacterioferritin (cytochrome b1)